MPATAPTTGNAGAAFGAPLNSLFVTDAQKDLGDPYVYGATGPSSFDCSGLVQYLLGQLGISAPRTSEQQWAWVDRIPASQLQPGDLVFGQFPGDNASPGHVGIYVGQAQGMSDAVLSAESPQSGVAYSSLASWGSAVVGYGRVPGVDYSGQVAPAASGSGSGSGGGSSFLSDLATATGGLLSLPSSWISAVIGAPTDIAGSITYAAGPFVKAAQAIDWFMHPGNWIRILAGIGGGGLVIAGLWNLSHVGRPASMVAGVPVSAGAAASLPFGIAEVTFGAVLLFIAFHNLPATVIDMPTLIGYLSGKASTDIAAQKQSLAGTGGASS